MMPTLFGQDGKTPVATLALTDRQIDTGRYGQEVDRFVGSIRT